MKYDLMLPNMHNLQVCGCMMYSKYTGPCHVCGAPTHYIEINYDGWFCSSECLRIFEEPLKQEVKDGTTT